MHCLKFLICFFIISVGFAQTKKPWQDPKIVGLNKEKYHVSVIPYEDLKSAIKADKMQSVYYQSLNGIWKLHNAATLADTIPAFFLPETNVANWANVQIPTTIQQDSSNNYLYDTNLSNLFEKNNPVNSYRTVFTVPEEWYQREVFINFDGVTSTFYLWVNGQKIGYSENSYSPAEFNISKYLKQGENIVAVQTFTHSDGSMLENGGSFQLSGIFRNVYLYCTPRLQIRDFKVETDFDHDYKNATIKIKGEVRNLDKRDLYKYSVEFALYDAKGKEIFREKSPLFSFAKSKSKTKGVNYEKLVVDPKKWNPETPYLYALVITMWSDKEKILEILSTKVGFREIDIRNNVIYNNGKQLTVRGAKLNDAYQYEAPQAIAEQIRFLKRYNINTIRTTRPLAPEYYESCNQYGIYILDEAGIEPATPLLPIMQKDSAWTRPVLDRCYSLVESNKNHPSVIAWSVANKIETGNKIFSWIQEHDKTRPIKDSLAGSWIFFNGIKTSVDTLLNYKYDVQPIKITYSDLTNKKLMIKNFYEATNLNEIEVKWELNENNICLQSGWLKLDIWPGEEKEIMVPFKTPIIKPGKEYWLNLSFRLEKSTSWCDKTHEIARNSFLLPEKVVKK